MPKRLRYMGIITFLFCVGHNHSIFAQAFKSRYFQSNGVEIHYMDEGQGKPVLLIHGLASNFVENWVQPGIVDSLLDHGFRVIAYDTRGHGKSSKPHNPEKYGFNDIKDAIHLMDYLSIRRANIVGYSRGASIANAIRAFYPERCITVTLGGYGRVGQNLNVVEQLPRNQVADSIAQGNAAPLLRAIIPLGQSLNSEQINTINQILIKNHDQHALSAAFRAGSGYYVSVEELKINRIPTLALVGEYDPMKRSVRAMEKIMTNLTVERIQGTGHMNAIGHADFIKNLLQFISEYD